LRIPTFLDYLVCGTQISFTIAIDYTGSNGLPNTPESLHFNGPAKPPNEYMNTFNTIGDIVSPYNKDQLIPVFGFGAKLLKNEVTSHCFPVNNDDKNPNCIGMHQVMAAYRSSFSLLQLNGPTHFTPVITQVCKMAESNPPGSKYHVLLIITDGEINDMDQTRRILKRASELPVTIIIVGVGSADFSSMKVLDDEERVLGLKRDVVQFVSYRNYKDKPLAKLAKDTLSHVPKQFMEFMKQHRTPPHWPQKVQFEFI